MHRSNPKPVADLAYCSACRFATDTGFCNSYFSIDQLNGTIRTVVDIDREEVERQSDSDVMNCPIVYTEQLSTQTDTVIITILDENDNVPRFFELSQPEVQDIESFSGPLEVLRLEPVDNDKGENGTTSFNITRGNELGYFRIKPPEGGDPNKRVLFLEEQFSNPITQFNLTITIRDNAENPNIFEQVIILRVANINIEPPTFAVTSFTYNLRENHPVGPDHPFANITVSNAQQVQGNVVYTLIPEGGHKSIISVNSSNGQLYLTEQVDYEGNSQDIVFHIRANNPSINLDDEVYVTVMKVDVNDNPPHFLLCSSCTTHTTHTSVIENANLSSWTLFIQDRDSTLVNKRISQVDITRSDPRIGEINVVVKTENFVKLVLSLNSSLDREITPNFTLNVTFYNEAEPHLSGSVTLTVTVLDTNDNTPTFPQDVYNVRVAEGSPIGKEVVHLEAYDEDEGENGTITYSIVSVDDPIAQNWFHISPTNGIISIASLDIDYISVSGRVTLTVSAADNANDSLSSTVEVVIDISPTLTFSPSSYAEFEQFNLVDSEHYSVYLELRTKRTEGVLLFQQRPSGSVVLLELRGGFLYFQHNSNSSVNSLVMVSDDRWYSVRVQRHSEVSHNSV